MTTRTEIVLRSLATVAWVSVLLAFFAGCGPRVQCFEIAVIPGRRVAIIQDLCRGTVVYQAIPALPDEPPPLREATPQAPRSPRESGV